MPSPRLFLAGDLAALAEAQRRCFPSEVWDEKALASLTQLSSTLTLVIEEQGIVAFLLLQVTSPEAEILTLGVVPEKRRQGLAVLLLVAAMELLRAQGVQRLLLEVAKDNAAALSLYAKMGFTQKGHRKSYYKREGLTIDAFLLECALFSE